MEYYFYFIGQSPIPLVGNGSNAFGLFKIETELDIIFKLAGYSSTSFIQNSF